MPADISAERIITRVLRGIGYLGRTSTPTADDLDDAMDTLNEMLDSFSRESLLVPYTLMFPFTCTDGVSLYTVGPTATAGNVITPRPFKIDRASIRIGVAPNQIEQAVYCCKNSEDWQRILAKTTTSTLPLSIWYNPKQLLGELNVYPMPSGAPVLLLYIQDQLTRIANLATEITVDVGVLRMIRYNLGFELHSEFGVDLPAGWLEKAIQSKAVVKSSNLQSGLLHLPDVPNRGQYYAIQSDGYRQGGG